MPAARADGPVSLTRKALVEAAIDRAAAATDLVETRAAAASVDQVIDACCSSLAAARLLSSVGTWTEDHFAVDLSPGHRAAVSRLRRARVGPYRTQTKGVAAYLGRLCDLWRRQFGEVSSPTVGNASDEALRATAYVLAGSLGMTLKRSAELHEECRLLGIESDFLAAQWPVQVDDFARLSEEFGALEEQLCDDAGTAFSRHDQDFSEEGTASPHCLTEARASAPADEWIAAEIFWRFVNGEPTKESRAIAWRDLVAFGLERVDSFVDDYPDQRMADLWRAHGAELSAQVESAKFWFVVSRGFFRPDDWVDRAAALRPVITYVGVLRRLDLVRELKELKENFILGNWIAVLALARVLMERGLKERLGLSPEDQTIDAETLVNRFCDEIREHGSNGIRNKLYRLRDAGNKRLHRHEAELLRLGDDALRFDEAALVARARESIDTLHRLFRLLESGSGSAA